MGYRQWIYTNEGAIVGLQYRAINEVIGVGAITDDEGLPLLGTSLHEVVHRGDIGIEARTDILQVEDEEVNIGEHLGGRALALSVEAHYGKSRLLVHTATYILPCIDLPTKTMLGDEETYDIDALGEEGIYKMRARTADERTLIDHQRDALTLEGGEEELHALSTHGDRSGELLCTSRGSPREGAYEEESKGLLCHHLSSDLDAGGTNLRSREDGG